MQNGEELLIEPSKQAQADSVVNYLKYLDLEQRIIALRIQELELNKEELILFSSVTKNGKQEIYSKLIDKLELK